MDSAGAIAGPLIALADAVALRNPQCVLGCGCAGALCVLAAWAGIREVRRRANGTMEGAEKSVAAKSKVRPTLSTASSVKLPATFLSCAVRGDAVFDWQFQRYVSGAASAECRDPGGARAIARIGFQHHLYAWFMARGMV